MEKPARTALAAQWLCAIPVIVAFLVCQAPAVAQVQRTPLEIAQGARCRKCHKDVVADFPASLHGKTVKFLGGSDSASCDACHGDGTKHVRSAKAEDIRLTPEQETGACLKCHDKERGRRAWMGSPHDRTDMSCNSCHSMHHEHGAALLRTERVSDACFTCHRDIQKAIYQRSTHLFRTEQQTAKVDCSSCHDPHGGQGRTMLVASSTNDVCYTCHAEKRGPFLWEHPPVREDCSNCHVPHGSNNPSLLRAQSALLCQQCHMFLLSRHQTVAGYDVFTFNRGCVNCHSRIHGSNHPSGKGLTQ